MRIPTTPPFTSLEALLAHRELVLETVYGGPEARSPEQDGRYLHWDELRFRAAPAGLDHAAWWHAVRWARFQISRPIPLVDDQRRPFVIAMTDTMQRLVHEVDRQASGRNELPPDLTSDATRDRYLVSSLIEEAITSSQLEGASTTRAVAKEMLRARRAPRTPDERMIRNNFDAMAWVREHVREPLTPGLILELQRILTRDTLKQPDGAGRLRRADEPVQVVDLDDGTVLHVPPPAATLPARMTALCTFANGGSPQDGFVHPVVRAILLHFWLAYDHPFIDGNGRTARALFYWSMLRQGYWLTELLSISRVIQRARDRYDRAFLFAETDGNDTTYFLRHQLDVVREAIGDLASYLERKAIELRAVEQRLRTRDDLNHRQVALLAHAVRKPATQYTIEGHQTSHRVVYQTARTDLLALVERGYLTQARRGRRLVFSPVAGLDRKLGRPKR